MHYIYICTVGSREASKQKLSRFLTMLHASVLSKVHHKGCTRLIFSLFFKRFVLGMCEEIFSNIKIYAQSCVKYFFTLFYDQRRNGCFNILTYFKVHYSEIILGTLF